MHAMELVLGFPLGIAPAVHGALAPESGAEVPKTSARVTLVDGRVVVTVVAEDLPSLRAALNSYLRWADAAERAARITD
jgi:tRNA threonylcarbamoyladenosine modification (KEOPS) complex  Pcc1 subunit